jgi:hypothetical protein
MKRFLDQLPAVVIVLLTTLIALGVSMVVIFVLTAVEPRGRWNEHFTPQQDRSASGLFIVAAKRHDAVGQSPAANNLTGVKHGLADRK